MRSPPGRGLAAALCTTLISLACPVRAEGMDNLYAAINGFAVAPTDPFYYTVHPPDVYEDLPYPEVTGRVIGFPTGIVMMVYRVFMATGDLVFFPLWVLPVFGPEPDFFVVIEDVEYEI